MEYNLRLPALSLDAHLWGLQGLRCIAVGICLLLVVQRSVCLRCTRTQHPIGCLPPLDSTWKSSGVLSWGKEWDELTWGKDQDEMQFSVLMEKYSFSEFVVFFSA